MNEWENIGRVAFLRKNIYISIRLQNTQQTYCISEPEWAFLKKNMNEWTNCISERAKPHTTRFSTIEQWLSRKGQISAPLIVMNSSSALNKWEQTRSYRIITLTVFAHFAKHRMRYRTMSPCNKQHTNWTANNMTFEGRLLILFKPIIYITWEKEQRSARRGPSKQAILLNPCVIVQAP